MSRSSKIRIRDARGTAIAETAIVTVLLLGLALGVAEFGMILSRVHTMTTLSREGANLAARGSSLQEATDITMANGSDIDLSGHGGVVASRLLVQGGTPRVVEQIATAGYSGSSRIGDVGDDAMGVDSWGMVDGQSVYVMELFYQYEPITPFAGVVDQVIPETLYERAVF